MQCSSKTFNTRFRPVLFIPASNGKTWSPHRVELALWTHYVASELKPELLDGIPGSTENGNSHPPSNGEATEPSDDSNQEAALNGKELGGIDPAAIDENSMTTSFTEDSMDKPATPITAAVASEDTNDSLATNDNDNDSNNTPRPTDSEDTEDSQDVQEPPTKKSKKWPTASQGATNTSNNVSTLVSAANLTLITARRF